MKRQLCILFLLASLILAACNGGAGTEPPALPADSAGPGDSENPTDPATLTETVEPTTTETEIVPALPAIPSETGPFSVASYDGKSLVAEDCSYGGYIQSVEATTPILVTFTLCKPDPAFLSKIALGTFAIYPKEWIEATSGDEFRSAEGLEKPIGTGPYQVAEWKRGESITFVEYPGYWSYTPSAADTLVFRWSSNSTQRLQALQSGIIDGLDNVSAAELPVIQADPALQMVTRPGLNTSYIGMNNIFPPFNNVKVRQAIALGIDRQRLVNTFYPPGSEVASHFTPCLVTYGCAGDAWYTFDAYTAKNLLAEVGYPEGFKTRLYYRDVDRDYLPRVSNLALDIKAQLKANLNIEVEIVPMEASAFIKELNAGRLDGLYLYGGSAAYPRITNFLDNRFGRGIQQFGNAFPDIYDNLVAGAQSSVPADVYKYYTDANNAIRRLIPMIPITHRGSVVAFRTDVETPQANPLNSEFFFYSRPGNRDSLTWMQDTEPKSLFCADETTSDSTRACAQVTESLYTYEVNGTATKPSLATDCTPDADLAVWVCTLRQGVKFHDGSELDSEDVVATFNMALNPGSPYHKGNTNLWETYSLLWGLMWK